MISEQPSFLKKLDISWNELFGRQIETLFAALAENKDLEYLNIAMTSLSKHTDTKDLRKFIRRNSNLLHLDLSGMFKTAEQVRGIVKAVKKS